MTKIALDTRNTSHLLCSPRPTEAAFFSSLLYCHYQVHFPLLHLTPPKIIKLYLNLTLRCVLYIGGSAGYLIPEIRNKNFRGKKSNYQSAYFTVGRDMSPNLKLALDILCYSGVLSSQGTVKIAERKTGLRYMVHLCLLMTEKAFAASNISDAINSLSLTDYREFSSNDRQIAAFLDSLKESTERCPNCHGEIAPNAKFCSECGSKIETGPIISALLDEPVDGLSISDRLKARVRPHFPRVGDIIQARREEIMSIKWIKEVRSRIIKNAADEFISG